jgi:hypothetical protein
MIRCSIVLWGNCDAWCVCKMLRFIRHVLGRRGTMHSRRKVQLLLCFVEYLPLHMSQYLIRANHRHCIVHGDQELLSKVMFSIQVFFIIFWTLTVLHIYEYETRFCFKTREKNRSRDTRDICFLKSAIIYYCTITSNVLNSSLWPTHRVQLSCEGYPCKIRYRYTLLRVYRVIVCKYLQWLQKKRKKLHNRDKFSKAKKFAKKHCFLWPQVSRMSL